MGLLRGGGHWRGCPVRWPFVRPGKASGSAGDHALGRARCAEESEAAGRGNEGDRLAAPCADAPPWGWLLGEGRVVGLILTEASVPTLGLLTLSVATTAHRGLQLKLIV